MAAGPRGGGRDRADRRSGPQLFPQVAASRSFETYNVQTTRELEDREIRETSVYRLLARPGAGPT